MRTTLRCGAGPTGRGAAARFPGVPEGDLSSTVGCGLHLGGGAPGGGAEPEAGGGLCPHPVGPGCLPSVPGAPLGVGGLGRSYSGCGTRPWESGHRGPNPQVLPSQGVSKRRAGPTDQGPRGAVAPGGGRRPPSGPPVRAALLPAEPCPPGTVFRPRDPATPPGPPGGSRLEPLPRVCGACTDSFPIPVESVSVFSLLRSLALASAVFTFVWQKVFFKHSRSGCGFTERCGSPGTRPLFWGLAGALFGSLQAYFRGGGSGRGPSGSAGPTPKKLPGPRLGLGMDLPAQLSALSPALGLELPKDRIPSESPAQRGLTKLSLG